MKKFAFMIMTLAYFLEFMKLNLKYKTFWFF